VTLRTAEGAEILLHIGIDTVTLKGAGFHSLVRARETVRAAIPAANPEPNAITSRMAMIALNHSMM
jgi:phosphotransferase system IIA component